MLVLWEKKIYILKELDKMTANERQRSVLKSVTNKVITQSIVEMQSRYEI